MKVFVRTFGCQMNKHDSERIIGYLESLGNSTVDSPHGADLIIVNTCAVRERAVERLKGYINSFGDEKRRGALIAVAGCVAQVEKEELYNKLPFVDIVFGPDDIDLLPQLIAEAMEDKKASSTEFKKGAFASVLPASREKPFHAWMAVTKGCNNFCSYCIVPYARGNLESRTFEDIIKEAKKIKDERVVEVTLLGQNVNSYGKDLYGKPKFAELLAEISAMGFKRVSFATSHPRDLNEEIMDVIAENKNISRQVHLPIQSGSTKILRMMHRGYTQQDYLTKVKKLKDKIEDISITTDIMVGFPGETENDFNETLKVIKEVQFDQAYTFIYSPRPKTKAQKMDGKVSEEVKKRRFEVLVEELKKVTLEKNKREIGSIVEAIVEGKSKKGNKISGRTEKGKVILFEENNTFPGDIVKVKVKQAGPHHLCGVKIVENSSKKS